MSLERKCFGNNVYYGGMSERYIGKVQYLRHEHGYIRSKTKINGIRDITFNFNDINVHSVRTFEIGDIVSFRVNMYSSGKFCATDIRKEDKGVVVNSQRSPSPNSIQTNDESRSILSFDSDIPSFSSRQEMMNEYFEIPSVNEVISEKDQFSRSVDLYLEKVLTRNFNTVCNSCWLTF